MKTQNTVERVISLETISDAITKMVDNLLENARTVGGMIADRMQTDPDTIAKLVKVGHSRILLDNLYRIGLGELDARLLIDDSPAARMIRHLPSAEQSKLLDDGVKVISLDRTGKAIQTIKPVTMLTQNEVKRVFDEQGYVRPPEDQVPLVKPEPKPTAPKAARYQISDDGDTIIVLEPTEFTLSHWIEISENASERQKQFLAKNIQKRQVAK